MILMLSRTTNCRRRSLFPLTTISAVSLALAATGAVAQSTFGAFVGTVRDASGAVVVGAMVQLTNLETGTVRTVKTSGEGQYDLSNIDPGKYKILITMSGFQTVQLDDLTLLSRETRRADAVLGVGQENTVVDVQAAAAVINTDTSNISEVRTGVELNTLPLAVSSRAGGSTSPYATLTSQAGVQTDASGNISVAGAKPSLLSVTVDGISTMNVRSGIPSPELFPSFNTIQEIRISQNANAAEFGGISDITTVSRGGTNAGHGGAFDNYETAGFNAKDSFAAVKPKLVMNDFGIFYGGPFMIPHMYNGHDKTFYFLSYEGLRLPQQTNVVQSVPTLAMRNGDLSAISTQVKNTSGVAYAGNQIPSSDISAVSKNLLARYYPLPNYGAAGAITNNYQQNFNTPIQSDQGDARIDQTLTSRQSFYVRYSYKQRSKITAPTNSASTGGSALIGTFNTPEKDTSLSGTYNFVITPRLFNEFRAGLSKFITATSFNDNSSAFSSIGITGIPDLISPSIAASPNVRITGFTAAGGTGSSKSSSRTYQFIDNVTYTRGNHSFKTGVDFRRMYAYAGNVFGSSRLGRYVFNGSSTVGKTVGTPFAAFLLGVPDTVTVSDVLAPDMNGYGNAYAVYAQDDFKVSNRLTLNYGIRYEYHPMLRDQYENSANFLPDYVSTINGKQVRGAIIVPGTYALQHNVLPAFTSGVAPIPIMTAAQAGASSALVTVSRTDIAPRFGFAWRPYGGDKTVVRGGVGRFIAGALGGNVVGGWAVSGSSVSTTTNAYAAGKPTVSFPAPFGNASSPAVGSLDFDYAITPHYTDPTVTQWNMTVEQDLGFATGLRLTYTGSHGSNLGLTTDLNQAPMTTGATNTHYLSTSLNSIYDTQNLAENNYNSGTVEVTHRMTKGLQFQSSYAYVRNLSDEGGINPTANASEIGGSPSDRFHPGVDYGNVIYSRRHRFMGSFVYNLPFGRNQSYLGATNRAVDALVGGWQMGAYFLAQSGPFLTPITPTDPTGTGEVSKGFVSYERPDFKTGVSPYASGKGATTLLSAAGFTNPASNIGRQGNVGVGSVTGRGTNTFSMSLLKSFRFTEISRFEMGAQVQNLFNRHNFDVPSSLDVTTSNFGVISSMQKLDNAGPRAISLTGRLTF